MTQHYSVLLPESLAFLILQRPDRRRVAAIVSKIAVLPEAALVHFETEEKKLPGVPVRHLFSDGRAAGTLAPSRRECAPHTGSPRDHDRGLVRHAPDHLVPTS